MSRRHHLASLREHTPVVLPSLLLCDYGDLKTEVKRLEAAGVQALHLDVMDGVFVPNISYGMPIVEALRKLTDLPLDVHLMIQDPAKYARSFFDAGADIITFHAEAVEDPRPLLQEIRDMGAGTGLVINPQTPVSSVAESIALCDLFLVMSVNAGFGGQKFDPVALEKLREVRQLGGPDLLLEVDGGINTETIAKCAEAGAQLLVAGSAIFGKTDYQEAVRYLEELANV